MHAAVILLTTRLIWDLYLLDPFTHIDYSKILVAYQLPTLHADPVTNLRSMSHHIQGFPFLEGLSGISIQHTLPCHHWGYMMIFAHLAQNLDQYLHRSLPIWYVGTFRSVHAWHRFNLDVSTLCCSAIPCWSSCLQRIMCVLTAHVHIPNNICLLYTSDAADE